MRLPAPTALALLALALAGAGACGGGGADPGADAAGPDAGPAPEVTQISITPPNPTIVVVNNEARTVVFRAYGLTPAGDTVEVTPWTRFTSQAPSLLTLDQDGVATTSRQLAGPATVRASMGLLSVTTVATVIQRRQVVEDGTPAEAPGWFEAASVDPTPARAPGVMYPSAGTILPPNFPGLELHFLAGQGNDVFEVTMAAGPYEYRRYAACTRTGVGCRVVPSTEDWAVFGPRFAGQDVEVSVAGLARATPTEKAVSSTRTLVFAIEELDAALYYWAATDGRLYRVDFGRAGAGAELFYSGGDCVGCHALSRDGTRAAIGIGSPSPSGLDLVDVASGDLLWEGAVGSTAGSNYQAFSPDATKVLTTDGFSMRLRDAATGADLGPSIQSGALFPDWSADGSRIVFAQKASTCTSSPCGDFTLGAGSIVSRPTDDGLTFGAAQSLVVYDGSYNNYYPAFTPDSAWIVFNRVARGASAGMDSYDNRDATLWMIGADGGTPVRLSQADGGYRGSSWPKLAPKLLATSRGYVTFVTFSSRRPIGLRPSTETAQIWMAAFDPARAAEGLDPSAAAVHVPWQDPASGNHIAQWATDIPRQPCGPDMTCPGGEICEAGQCVPQIE